MTETLLCACGCGKEVDKQRYARYHKTRYYKNNKILCKCGCSQFTNNPDTKYVLGHNNTILKNRIIANSEEAKKLRLCVCGCGRQTEIGKKFPFSRNKYINGHSHKGLEEETILRLERQKNMQLPLCLCGCGQQVTISKRYPHEPNLYVANHRKNNSKLERVIEELLIEMNINT